MKPIASHEYENACIVSALQSKSVIPNLLQMDVNDFYYDIHRVMYTAINELFNNYAEVDAITIQEILHDKPEYIKAGGDNFLADMLRSHVVAANFNMYRDKVQDLSRRRKTITTYKHSVEELEDNANIDDVTAEAENYLKEISAPAVTERLIDKDLEWITEEGNKVLTGYTDLDAKLGGLYASELIILAARPSMGKSAQALDIGINVVKNSFFDERVKNKRVLVFSLEMSLKQISQRIIANLSGIDMWKFRKNKLTDHERMLAQAAFDEYKKYGENLIIVDNIYKLNMILNKAKEEQPDLVIVDYLQLIEVPGSEQRYLKVGHMSRSLKKLSKSLNIPVLAASQLSRAVENRVDMVPRLSDLRESGDIEQDADVVMFLHGDKESDFRNIIVAKSRQSQLGLVDMWFRQNTMQFQNAGGE